MGLYISNDRRWVYNGGHAHGPLIGDQTMYIKFRPHFVFPTRR